MAVQPPNFGGRKDLTDRMATRQPLSESARATELWQREEDAREAAEHPVREKLLYWALVAVLVLVVLGALTFVAVYLFHVFGG